MGGVRTLRAGCEFDSFLYASLGEDDNGTPLTVLSALARMDLDPWEEAAQLMRLPEDVAVMQLGTLLGALRNVSEANLDSAHIALPLIALLPRPVHHAQPLFRRFAQATPGKSPAMVSIALSVLVYVIFMLLSQWWMGNLQASNQRPIQPAATSAATTDSPVTQAVSQAAPTIGGPR